MLYSHMATRGAKIRRQPAHIPHEPRPVTQQTPGHDSKSVLTEQLGPALEMDLPPKSCLIHPRSNAKQMWDTAISLCIVYSVVIVPLRVGFFVTNIGKEDYLENAIDAMFGIDIVLSFFTSFQTAALSAMETQHKAIAVRYLKTWFLVDFLSTFPFEAVAEKGASLGLLRILRLARLLKLLRLLRLRQLVRSADFLQEALSISPSVFRLLGLLFRILYMLHLLSCTWFFIVVSAEGHSSASFQTEHLFDNSTTTELKFTSVAQQYLTTFYFITVTTFGAPPSSEHCTIFPDLFCWSYRCRLW